MMKPGKIAITGVGETPFLRKGEEHVMQMMTRASLAAIADAGLKPTDIDGYIINKYAGHPSEEIAHAIGAGQKRFSAVADSAGGTATTGDALRLAQLAIEAGLCKHVLVPYAIRSTKPGGVYAFHAREPQKAGLEMPAGFFGQPTYFASMANRYAHEYGMTEEEQAALPMTYRAWAAITPSAQRRDPMDLAAYRASPMISTPLRVADCCLTTDGGGAYVVSSVDYARHLPHPVVAVQGLGLGYNNYPHGVLFSQKPCTFEFPVRESAAMAYAMAGISPADLDLAQVYDGFTISALVQTEMLGLCDVGEAPRFYAAGHAMPGGKMPINTSGGHMSGGYVPGINLLIEAVRQLRGGEGARQVPDARLCAIAGLGGNNHSTTILARM
ncbi:acetyl-CoA acetyltransferase [Novosphingobium sp. 1748]|uniref:thiolase family protein n=1 Tax=unclassified Novosphingobium TaxID=2644732 RepID=UPI000A5275B6|nr:MULTISPECIES: thiolase family protein [unclassified Novosphingobium]MDR6709083.1 acetyl-CoA acetyltransferase [Novosphingobium sp. 1748]